MIAQKYAQTNPAQSLQGLAAESVKRKAHREMLQMLLAGLGVGAAARGGLGLVRLLNRNLAAKQTPTYGPLITPIPLEESEEAPTADQTLKAAQVLSQPTSKWGYWPYPTSLLVGTPLAMIGSWTMVDKLLDARRKAEQKARLQRAQQDFEEALLHHEPKTAGASSPLGQALDQLYDSLEKQSIDWAELWRRLVSNYGAYAAGTGAAAFLFAYTKGQKHQRRALLEQAQRKRRTEAARIRPAEVYAVPTRVHRPVEEEPELAPDESPNTLRFPSPE